MSYGWCCFCHYVWYSHEENGKDCVAPLNPKLYKRYVDDTITKRKKNTINDELFANMNSHHKNIKLTAEKNPTRFLDTAFNVNPDVSMTTKIFRKLGQFPAFWNSQIPKRYKRNNINGDLHRAFKTASDFDAEVSIITKKYLDAGYPLGFIKSVISDFKKKDENQPIIPDWLFEEHNKVLFKLPYCPSNEYDVKRFIYRIESFTGGKVILIVLWSTRNINILLSLKDKVMHRSCVIYEGQCSCKLSYIGETKRSSEVRWREHDDPADKTEPAKHLMENASHKFTWKVLSAAPSHFRRRRILEAFFITIRKPVLNDQVEHHSFTLFRHGIT